MKTKSRYRFLNQSKIYRKKINHAKNNLAHIIIHHLIKVNVHLLVQVHAVPI